MHLRLSIFTKIFLAFSGLAMVPLLISAALISSNYQNMADEIALKVLDRVSPEEATQVLNQVSAVHMDAYILMFFVLLISVILVVFAALYISRSFSNPITALLEASRQIAHGNLDVRLTTDRGDEFGQLAEGFNTMARQLEDVKGRMEQANLDLEQRVAERTAELTMANTELRTRAAQIQEANRLKSEFLANMSHELRTPLNAILGYSDLLRDGIYGELTDQQGESLNKVRRNAEALLRLINDILDLSKIEAGRMSVALETFDPGELAANSVAGLRPLFDRKGVKLRAEIARHLPKIEADRGKVQQILYNLLSNALKFTDHGQVTVRAYAAKDRKQVWFEVADTGQGIPGDRLRVIFDQFRQIDGSSTRAAGGTGLGLALCKKLINLLNGTIDVESAPGEGSTFRFSLPVSPRPAVAPEAATKQRRRQAVESRTVLAIDDDEEVLELLAASLEPAGYKVVRCTDPDAGVRQAKEMNPYAVTLDIMMPYRDGWSVLRELRSTPETADIPVIIVSIIDDQARAYSLGVQDYMVKPINRRALVARLDSFGDEDSVGGNA